MSEPVVADGTPGDMVVLGKVVAPYGLRGEVKVFPFADDSAVWGRLTHWWIGSEGSDPAQWRQVRVARCKVREGVLVAALEGLADRDAAEAAKGLLVGVPHDALPPTADNEYYWADLIGLSVVNTQDQALGHVLGLIETSANAVLRVGDGEGAERLLPFVAAVVLEVDLAARRIRVEWEADW